MRKILFCLFILALIVPLAHGATKTVLVKDDFFDPGRVRITKGDSVTWRWRGDDVHNVALKRPGSNRIVRRSALKTDGSFTHKFRRVGKWRYLCENHEDDMRGRVIVRSP